MLTIPCWLFKNTERIASFDSTEMVFSRQLGSMRADWRDQLSGLSRQRTVPARDGQLCERHDHRNVFDIEHDRYGHPRHSELHSGTTCIGARLAGRHEDRFGAKLDEHRTQRQAGRERNRGDL
jgi:hypothetical protein